MESRHGFGDRWLFNVLLFFFYGFFHSFGQRNLMLLVFDSSGLLDASIDRDSEQPCAESSSTVEAVSLAVDQGENFLDGVCSLIRIEKDASCDGIDLVVISRIEGLERVLIPRYDPIDETEVFVKS